MKVALCFIINYEHVLNKEAIWREWIEYNLDIINVYFFYKDYRKIKSKWIADHCVPVDCIYNTSYFHVIPAYLSVMNFAFCHDKENRWFCMLTDSCCPIISPKRFRHLFLNNFNKSVFSWKPAWWNPNYHKRGNLKKLPKEFWLGNEPWFVLSRENLFMVFKFNASQHNIIKTICDGGFANETLFAVIFQFYKVLNSPSIICSSSHIVDWNRMSSTTSPHVFKDADERDITFINTELERNKYAMFIRKVDKNFPEDILRYYIYEHNKEEDDKHVHRDDRLLICIVICTILCFVLFYLVM